MPMSNRTDIASRQYVDLITALIDLDNSLKYVRSKLAFIDDLNQRGVDMYSLIMSDIQKSSESLSHACKILSSFEYLTNKYDIIFIEG